MKKELNIESSINLFIHWLDGYGETSFDIKDLFSSKLGVAGKKLFYKNKILGLPFAILSLFHENFLPSITNLFSKKRREAIGDAHYALGFLNLYVKSGNKEHLLRAEHFLSELKKSSLKNHYPWHCWGYTFGWQNSGGFCSLGTPFITVTPYPFRAFLKHYEITQNSESKAIAISSVHFAIEGLNRISLPNKTQCYSYSPTDQRSVINANSYKVGMLVAAYSINRDEHYLNEAQSLVNFILSYQNSDGSWFYDAIHPGDHFIDNFHTCFTLKGLITYYKETESKEVFESLKKGVTYYENHLLREDFTPIPYAFGKKQKLSKYETYDFAEAISLFWELGTIFPSKKNTSLLIANKLISLFQCKDGHFTTRQNSLGIKNNIPYHRWPQSQIFYALTNLIE